MKIWLVVMVFGKIAATVGPLPYDMAACQARLTEQMAEVDRAFATRPLASDARMQIDGRQVTRPDIVMKCLVAAERPS